MGLVAFWSSFGQAKVRQLSSIILWQCRINVNMSLCEWICVELENKTRHVRVITNRV
jgi:hypothetical protein